MSLPLILQPGEGESVKIKTSTCTFKVTGKDTNGHFGLFEFVMEPGTEGASPTDRPRKHRISKGGDQERYEIRKRRPNVGQICARLYDFQRLKKILCQSPLLFYFRRSFPLKNHQSGGELPAIKCD